MASITTDTRGVFIISVTPFNEDLSVDYDGIERLTDFYIEKEADGITVLGMMGEAHKLDHTEAVEVIKRTVRRAGGKPVVVGVSASGFVAMGNLAKEAMDLGAAGVMVAPSGVKTDRQIRDYYANAVAAIGEEVPMVLQDFPLSTGVNIDSGLLLDIFADNPSIVMIKHEDWPGLAKIDRIRQGEADIGRRVSILTGNGAVFLLEEMLRGADGAMTGFGYPEMMVDICRHIGAGEIDRAQDIFESYLPLARYEQQPGLGLAVRKFVLCHRGAIKSAKLRRPGAPLPQRDQEDVLRMIARQEKRLAAHG